MSEANLKVLIAEDNLINQQVLKSMLNVPNDDIFLADDGSIAVDKFQSEHVDFIFMDISMPNMDGIAATRKIREIEKLENKSPVPIVAVTANVSEETEKECFQAGMNHFITKPINKHMVNTALNTFCKCA